MLGNSERQCLNRQYPPEAVPTATLAAKCAAGLAILFGIALIGIQSPPAPGVQEQRVASAAAAPGPGSHDCDAAAPERDAQAPRGTGCGTPGQSGSGGTVMR